jgi:hypothetical protein
VRVSEVLRDALYRHSTNAGGQEGGKSLARFAARLSKRIFEPFAKSDISLIELRMRIRLETGKAYAKGYLHSSAWD